MSDLEKSLRPESALDRHPAKTPGKPRTGDSEDVVNLQGQAQMWRSQRQLDGSRMTTDGGGGPVTQADVKRVVEQIVALYTTSKATRDVICDLLLGLPANFQQDAFAELAASSVWKQVPGPPTTTPATLAGQVVLANLFTYCSRDAEAAQRTLEARFDVPHDSKHAVAYPELHSWWSRLEANERSPDAKAIAAARTQAGAKTPDQKEMSAEDVLQRLDDLSKVFGFVVTLDDTKDPKVLTNVLTSIASQGARHVSLNQVLPPPTHKDALTKLGEQLDHALAGVVAFNKNKADDNKIYVTYVANFSDVQMGLDLAQLNTQTVVGAGQHKPDAPVDPSGRKFLRCQYLLRRAEQALATKTDPDGKTEKETLSELETEFAGSSSPQHPTTKPVPDALYERIIQFAYSYAGDTKFETEETFEKRVKTESYASVGNKVAQSIRIVAGASKNFNAVVKTIQPGNEPESEWEPDGISLPYDKPGTADEAARDTAVSMAVITALSDPAGGESINATVTTVAHEWDPGTEKDVLDGKPTTVEAAAALIGKSPFHTKILAFVTAYIAWYKAKHHAKPTTVPLAVHAYNVPLISRGLVQCLDALGKQLGVILDVSVTEFQIDKLSRPDPHGAPQPSLADGVVDLGAQMMDEAAGRKNIHIAEMAAFTYTNFIVPNDPAQHFGLAGNNILGPLLGTPS